MSSSSSLFVAMALFLAAACGSESDPGPTGGDGGGGNGGGGDGGGGDGGGGDAATTPTPKDAGTTPGSQCTKSSDCAAHENTCGQCSCIALSITERPGACTDPVECFAPSCTGKVATCDNGRCAIVSK